MSAALDCVGGEATSAVTASLLPGGSTIIYGALGGPVLQMNILDVFLGKSLKVCSDMPCLHVALMDLSYMRCNSNEHLLTRCSLTEESACLITLCSPQWCTSHDPEVACAAFHSEAVAEQHGQREERTSAWRDHVPATAGNN